MLSKEEQLQELTGVQVDGKIDSWDYDRFLEFFRKVPTEKLVQSREWFQKNLPVEGFAAAARWIEIVHNPAKIDKLYQGKLKASARESIMELAVGDDDEAFYEALIRENVAKLDENRSSTQEVARLTQNINVFRSELREVRSRKPKKGTTLERVLVAAEMVQEKTKKGKKDAKKRK